MGHRIHLAGDGDLHRNVRGDEGEPWVVHKGFYVAELAGRKVVDTHDRVAPRQEGLAKMGSEETGTAGDDDSHEFGLFSFRGRRRATHG